MVTKMVTGFESFKRWFSEYSEQYTIIGGTACDLLMSEEGMDFRATRDIDMVLIVESLTPQFGERFWSYIRDAGYEHRNKSTGEPQFYRFTNPKSRDYPYMIELFSRRANAIVLSDDAVLTPLPLDHEISSLSAILLDDAYYQFLREGKTTIDGIPILDAMHLIPFKAKAWLDLRQRKEAGAKVDSKNIRKHKNDVIRLSMLLRENDALDLPQAIRNDMKVSYCIEPGIGQNAGDTLSHKDETFWENYPSHLNPTISPDTIKVLLGRIMQYGYQGNVSTSWRSQNASDAAALSYAIATQLLVWETVVGERDASFNKVYPSGYGKSAVWSYIRDEHPLRSQIRSYYNSMAASVQSHAEIPSFCARSIGSARSYELKYDGTRYTVTLTDTNGVLSNFSFSSSEPGISFSRSGNRLTITSDTPIAGDIRVSASKTNGVRSGVVVWTDGNKGAGIQDVVTYGENVSDPVSAYLRLEMEALGTMHLVKTSEDGVVANISFTISGNGITKTVTTGRDGTIDVSELMAGTYTVTEADIERYTPQTSQQVTIVGGQTSTVTFNNVLKRGALEVTKTSER